MKIKLLFLIFCLFYLSSVQSQRIFLETLVQQPGLENLKIGMSFNDFEKLGEAIRSGQTTQNEDLYNLITDNGGETFLGHNSKNEYAFNQNNILVSINWKLEDLENNGEGTKKNNIIDDLNSHLGKSNSEIEYDDEGVTVKKITWLQTSFSLVCYYRKSQNEAYISLTNISIPRDRDFTEIGDDNKKLIKSNRQGKGSGSFRLTLGFLEAEVNHVTLKKFELQLGEWTSYGTDNGVEYEYNNKTKDHDLPLFIIDYESKINGMYYTFNSWVPLKVGNYIKEFEVIATINGYQLGLFKKSLQSKGYVINENLSDIFNKQTWENKNFTVLVSRNPNASCSIKIFKNTQ
jgi:hypothetical protein